MILPFHCVIEKLFPLPSRHSLHRQSIMRWNCAVSIDWQQWDHISHVRHVNVASKQQKVFSFLSFFLKKNAPDVCEVLTGAAEFVQSQVFKYKSHSERVPTPGGPSGPGL